MSYYTIGIHELYPKKPRSKGAYDILLLSLSVFVNRRRQGFYLLTAPIFSGQPLAPSAITESATLNGYPRPKYLNAREPWTIGPIEVDDDDQVVIVYQGLNVSDDPNFVHTDAWNEGVTKVVSTIDEWLIGQFLVGLDLAFPELPDGIKEILPQDIQKFLDNPVGYILGVRPSGPCNGIVFKDALAFTGRDLAALAYEPVPASDFVLDAVGKSERFLLAKSYDDSDTHNEEICGPVAHTDVGIAIVRYEFYHLSWWGPIKGKMRSLYSEGLRKYALADDQQISVKKIFGLRN
ncbi:hypothetical protein FHT85_005939 [Rhizobium sp. BK312]|uniref:hypothetical protein n=1 Tax=Rhizobium sp. BK312 TaxID=2587080 RepID=UPI00161FC40C|nr:hypothetical protein [Rhizobium sp. BK312]MBB3428908.1 hypothetical protein [Rhizobium sp. BK312]